MSTIKVQNIQHTASSTNAISLASDGTCTANITNNLSNKNIIINGGMIVSQRNGTTATAVTSANQYTLDRIKGSNNSDAAFTIAQSSTAPDGFANSLKVDVTTADTSLGAAHYGQIIYRVEAQDLQQLAFGTSGAKASILSFYVRSNKTGNYGVAVLQDDNSSKQVTFQYTINSADTWERKSFVIPADTSGVINNDNGAGFDIHIGFAAGTTYTSGSLRSSFTAFANGDFYAGQGVNLFDSTSNEWYITGIQLEVDNTGSGKPTDFEHRLFNQELALCQRYYYDHLGGFPEDDTAYGVGSVYNAGYTFCYIPFRVQMRAKPTLETNDNANSHGLRVGATDHGFNKNFLSAAGTSSATIYPNVGTISVTAGQCGILLTKSTTNCKLRFSAEL